MPKRACDAVEFYQKIFRRDDRRRDIGAHADIGLLLVLVLAVACVYAITR